MKVVKMYQKQGSYLVEIPIDLSKEINKIFIPSNKIKFRVSSTDENINYFSENTVVPDASNFNVTVNSNTVNTPITDISYSEGDIISIQLKNPDSYFPFWKHVNENAIENGERIKCKISKILSNALPHMLINGVDEATDFSQYFYYQDLETVPEDLFSENPYITTFDSCFRSSKLVEIPPNIFRENILVESFSSCFKNTDIINIPSGLFSKCTEVLDFSNCFSGSSFGDNINTMNIQSIAPDLFKYNTKVTNFSECFKFNLVDNLELASSLKFNLIIGSPVVTDCVDFCSDCMDMTIYVPADSTTYNSFSDLGKSNITIKTFTNVDDVIIS